MKLKTNENKNIYLTLVVKGTPNNGFSLANKSADGAS